MSKSTSRSVLIIEDNRDCAESLARLLQTCYGFEVTTEHDGLAGLKRAAADHPDAVVCDIGLPGRNGLLVAEELASMRPKKPLLIAVSGFAEQVGGGLALACGFDHFFAKPADSIAIANLIAAHMGSATLATAS